MARKKIYDKELQRYIAHNHVVISTTDLDVMEIGTFFYNTTTNSLKFSDGTKWYQVNTVTEAVPLYLQVGRPDNLYTQDGGNFLVQ
jgi:hypothetical protein